MMMVNGLRGHRKRRMYWNTDGDVRMNWVGDAFPNNHLSLLLQDVGFQREEHFNDAVEVQKKDVEGS